jgi:hypothetical protein
VTSFRCDLDAPRGLRGAVACAGLLTAGVNGRSPECARGRGRQYTRRSVGMSAAGIRDTACRDYRRHIACRV